MPTDEDTMSCPKSLRFAVLDALYQNSQPLGMGWYQARPGPLPEEARRNAPTEVYHYDIEKDDEYRTDYVFGRPIKVAFIGDTVTRLKWYDRDNGGPGTARRIISEVLEKHKAPESVQQEAVEP